MTLKSISDQIDTIKHATENAAVSPQAARDFLVKAGIVSGDKYVAASSHTKISKKGK